MVDPRGFGSVLFLVLSAYSCGIPPTVAATPESIAAVEESDRAAAFLGPIDVVASPDGKTVFVACADAKRVAAVADGDVSGWIELPAKPTGLTLSPEGSTLYVTCATPEGFLWPVDFASGNVGPPILVGHGATGPAISPDGETLYVCNRFDNNVAAVGLKTGKVALVPTSREPYAAAVTPDGKSVFVINHLPLDRANSDDVASEITVIDTATNKTQTIRLPNGSTGMRGICVSPDGKHVYATHILSRYMMPTTQVERGWMNTNALSIIDAREKKLVNTVLLDDVDLGAANPWGVALTADGKTLCVTHAGTHEMSVIDADALLKRLLALPEKRDPDKRQASTDDVPNDLRFLGGLRRRVPLTNGEPGGKGPRGLAIVGSKAFAASYYTDNLSVVDLEPKPDNSEPSKPEPSHFVSTIALGPAPEMSIERRGEMLFNDATLCHQHWQSCDSCHPDARADALNRDLMNDGLGNPKNTRSMVLAHKTPPSMSLGVLSDAQAAVRSEVTHLLFAIPVEENATAIDEYLKSLKPVPSPYLTDGKLSPAAQRGKKLFFDAKVNCARCHPEPLFTDMLMHDVGSRGRYDRREAFDTPTLIECWRTAPYMHDGQHLTVKELLTKGKHGNDDGQLDKLSNRQIGDLVEYVLSLPAETSDKPTPDTVSGGNPDKKIAEESVPQRAADLAPPVRITAGGEPIDVDGVAAPYLADFDEDGVNDLLVGQPGYGRLRIYRNSGTNTRPKFDSFEWFKAGGRIAAVPIGCNIGFIPQLVDFDGDGRTDVLTGSYMEGAIYLFRRQDDGTFAAGEVLENKHGEVALGYVFLAGQPARGPIRINVTAFVHDWDGDGYSDLVIGKGHRCLVLNEGTREQPVFGDAMPIMVDGELLQNGVATPCMADWDGDGRDDLLAGLGLDVVWHRNAGAKGPPVFEAPRILVANDQRWRVAERPGETLAHPHAICAADFNGDGRLDLLLGDTYYTERSLSEERLAELDKSIKRSAAIKRECHELVNERPENETRGERIARFRKALAKWQELGTLPYSSAGQGDSPKRKRHGHVWLFERIDVER